MMKEMLNVDETILLDGEPLSLMTRAGVEAWIENDAQYRQGTCFPNIGSLVESGSFLWAA